MTGQRCGTCADRKPQSPWLATQGSEITGNKTIWTLEQLRTRTVGNELQPPVSCLAVTWHAETHNNAACNATPLDFPKGGCNKKTETTRQQSCYRANRQQQKHVDLQRDLHPGNEQLPLVQTRTPGLQGYGNLHGMQLHRRTLLRSMNDPRGSLRMCGLNSDIMGPSGELQRQM